MAVAACCIGLPAKHSTAPQRKLCDLQMRNMLRSVLHQHQVLLVLDNVSSANQVEEELLGLEIYNIPRRSQLLMFSRNPHILGVRLVHMPVLCKEDAAQLFLRRWRTQKNQSPTAEEQPMIARALELLTSQTEPQQHPLATRILAEALRQPPVADGEAILATFEASRRQGGRAELLATAHLLRQTSYSQQPPELQQLIHERLIGPRRPWREELW